VPRLACLVGLSQPTWIAWLAWVKPRPSNPSKLKPTNQEVNKNTNYGFYSDFNTNKNNSWLLQEKGTGGGNRGGNRSANFTVLFKIHPKIPMIVKPKEKKQKK